jgi:hypothetical protein
MVLHHTVLPPSFYWYGRTDHNYDAFYTSVVDTVQCKLFVAVVAVLVVVVTVVDSLFYYYFSSSTCQHHHDHHHEDESLRTSTQVLL